MRITATFNMETWLMITTLLVLTATIATESTEQQSHRLQSISPDELQKRNEELRNGKKQLARNLLTSELRNRDHVNVTPSFTWKLGSIQGTAASTYRSFNQSFILVGKTLYQLTESGSGPVNFTTKPVGKFEEFLGEVAFIESVEWEGLLYLLAAYKQGLAQLFTLSVDYQIILRQSIQCYGIPTDAEFFMQDENLFLVLSSKNGSIPVPTVVYRWYGNQLDEEDSHRLIGANAVSTFPFKESVIISVAFGSSGNGKSGLEVFKWTGKKLDLLQLFPSAPPISLQHFSFKSENYLLVTISNGPSIICWWAGTEMIFWDKVESEGSIQSIGVGYIRGETIILLAEETQIKMYRPTVASLQFIASHKFDTVVRSASLYIQDDSLNMVAITEANGAFVPFVVELQLVFQPAHVSHSVRDPLLQCMSSLADGIKSEASALEDVIAQRNKFLLLSSSGTFKGKLVVKKLVLNKASPRSITLRLGATAVIPESPSKLKDNIRKLSKDVESLNEQKKDIVFKSLPANFKYQLTADEFKIGKADLDSAVISTLNGFPFDPKLILMNSKEQTLTGTVEVSSMFAESLTVGSLNGNKVEDLLTRSETYQTVLELEKVKSIRTSKVVIKEHSTLNSIPVRRIVTSRSPGVISVAGTKTFAGLNLQELAVGLLNNVNFTEWIESLRPRPNPSMPMQTMSYDSKSYISKSDLAIQNLTVLGSINGVKFADLLSSLFLKGLNQNITGEIVFKNGLSVKNLQTSRINGIPTSSLMTRTTNQDITASLTMESLNAVDLSVNSLNGLKISEDAAYLNSPHLITNPVIFQKLGIHQLVLPPEASIDGHPVGKRLHPRKEVYKGTYKIKGTLKLTDVDLDNVNVIVAGKEVSLRTLNQKYWTKSSDQVIQHWLRAPDGLNVMSLTLNSLNHIPLDNFVDLQSTKHLQGTWHFPSATVTGNILHDPSAQQSPVAVKELSSKIVKTSGTYILSGTKVFNAGVATATLQSNKVDGVLVSEMLDNQDIGGSFYKEISVAGDLIVKTNLNIGSVNRVNLCDRLKKTLLINHSGHIPAAQIAVVTASNINVKTFNGVPFNLIVGSNQPSMPRVRKVTIIGDVSVPEILNVVSVNNKPLTEDYLSRVVNKSMSGLIRGRKTFASSLIVENSFDALHYNGENLNKLFSNMLSKTRDQTILSQVWLKKMEAKELRATHINKIDVNNLVYSDLLSRQTIEGDLLLTNDVSVLGHLNVAKFEDGCDLNLVAERLQTLDGRHWDSILVDGSLNWKQSLPQRVLGLGYYLGSAVTKTVEQIISGEIKFENSVSVRNFISRMNINDIDFVGILHDSLRKSVSEQVVRGTKIFSKQLHTSSMNVSGNVVAKKVAGIDIPKFNSSLVRVWSDQVVKGKKRFLQGFSANILNAGSVNGLIPSDVVNYDWPLLPAMNMVGPFEVKRDFSFDRANGILLNELLAERVTLDSPQQIEGHITFSRELKVEGDMVAPNINGVDIADLVQLDSPSEQIISGRKHFVENVNVVGPMEVDNLENVGLRMAYNAAILKDKNATISGNLIFNSFVTMDSNLDVSTTVNGVKMSDLSRALRRISPRSFSRVRSIARTINDTNSLLIARGDLSEMLYLEPVLDTSLSFTNTHQCRVSFSSANEVYLAVDGRASYAHCGLPASCSCPAQYTIHVNSVNTSQLNWNTGLKHNSSVRAFNFDLKEERIKVIVKTNTVSHKNQCRLYGAARLNEVTVLQWMEYAADGHDSNVNEYLQIEGRTILGYVSDVKIIVAGHHIYVVLGISYNADLDSTNVNSVIVRIDRVTKRARVVFEFPTHGVSSLDVFYTDKGPHLVVGNSFDSSGRTSETTLDIYRFNLLTEKLELLKRIPSGPVLSAVSVVQGGDSLIVIAQKELYAPIMVLKHDSAHDDYHFMQQLNSNAVPTGLGVFYVGQPGISDAYLGVSTSDDQFYLYKFKHIEGFKLVMNMELDGVKGFSSFSLRSKQYLLFTSSNRPSIFEVVKQSP